MKQTHRYNTSWDKIKRVFPEEKGLRVLDIGCGDGFLIRELIGSHRVTGVDRNPEAVRMTQQAGAWAVVGDVEDGLPFADGSFDVVMALDILEHVIDIPYVLSEIQRVLSNSGYFILSLPNHFDLRTRLDILLGRGIIRWSQRRYEEHAWTYSHIRFLTLKETRDMIESTGWQIDREQFNFMSGGIVPTRLVPKFARKSLVKNFPQAWSGKLVFRCRRGTYPYSKIIIDRTPETF